MAGRGPAPKPVGMRSRARDDKKFAADLRVVELPEADRPGQPELPETYKVRRYDRVEKVYDVEVLRFPDVTRAWWRMWGDHPMASEFTGSDWSELLDTAILHARFHEGEHSFSEELRRRTSRHGAAYDDRLRMRVHVAYADEAASNASAVRAGSGVSARARHKPLTAI